jgi:hypothetical protein
MSWTLSWSLLALPLRVLATIAPFLNRKLVWCAEGWEATRCHARLSWNRSIATEGARLSPSPDSIRHIAQGVAVPILRVCPLSIVYP